MRIPFKKLKSTGGFLAGVKMMAQQIVKGAEPEGLATGPQESEQYLYELPAIPKEDHEKVKFDRALNKERHTRLLHAYADIGSGCLRRSKSVADRAHRKAMHRWRFKKSPRSKAFA